MSEAVAKKRTDEDVETKARVLGGEADKRPPAADAEADPRIAELKTKIAKLVGDKFGGDYKKAFDHYNGNHDVGIAKAELSALLKDADVGNGFTRGVWADKILEKMDLDHDGRISWSEFQSGIKG